MRCFEPGLRVQYSLWKHGPADLYAQAPKLHLHIGRRSFKYLPEGGGLGGGPAGNLGSTWEDQKRQLAVRYDPDWLPLAACHRRIGNMPVQRRWFHAQVPRKAAVRSYQADFATRSPEL
jgi:hypothetical protein